MQEVLGQNPHFETGLVGLEPQATGFVPTQVILAFLNLVFPIPPAKDEANFKYGLRVLWQTLLSARCDNLPLSTLRGLP